MAVLSHREVIPRSYEHRLGGKPTATRVYVATVDGPTPSSQVIGAIGIQHGSSHPDHTALTCDNISLDEQDRHHVQVTYSYGIKDPNDPENPDQPPWLQPDVWTFSCGTKNGWTDHFYPIKKDNLEWIVLRNSAGDRFAPVDKLESEIKITISGARLQIKLSDMRRYCGAINSEPWLGLPARTVLCVGTSASPASLEFEGQVLPYWQLQTEFLFNSNWWDIVLPNVGYNVIINGKLERAYTYIQVDGSTRERIPTPEPIALNNDGGFKCPPE